LRTGTQPGLWDWPGSHRTGRAFHPRSSAKLGAHPATAPPR